MTALPLDLRLDLGTAGEPAHIVLELASYALAARLYLVRRRRFGDPLAETTRWTVVAAAALGAALGSKVLSWFVEPAELARHATDLVWLAHQKTIVGALLGGWLAVELAKRVSGIRARTGDLFAVPLCAGIALGRIGCFLAGPADRTHGVETALPWGVDHGDGVARHPVALYEALCVLALGLVLDRLERRPHAQGALFRLFLASYLALRVALDALKPVPRFLGLGTLQWACLVALAVLALGELRARRTEASPA